MAAYLSFIEQCAVGKGQRDASGVIRIAILLPVYFIGIFLQFASFPANFQLAKQRSAFLLLLQINISDTILLFYYIWIYTEFLLGDTIDVPFNLHTYTYRTAVVVAYHLSVVLALNRAIAVIAPFAYQKIFSIKRITVISIILWLYAVIESFILNWHPWLRIFHCVYKYPSITEPYTEIAGIKVGTLQSVLFNLKNNILRLAVFLIYIIATIWLAFKKFYKSGEITSHNNNGNGSNSQADTLYLNLMQERIRIYMICLIGVLPTFIIFMQGTITQLALLFNTAEYIEKIQKDPIIQNILIGNYQIWAAIYIVQQPILMFSLSTDFRKEFKKTFGKYIRHTMMTNSSVMYPSNARY